MNPRPRRSILFVLVTGEEAGLLGSDYFAHYPTVPKSSMVAQYQCRRGPDAMADAGRHRVSGAEHSSLDAVIKKAAARMNVVESPDPMRTKWSLIRSDQYSFVKQGIPSTMPSPGFKSSDPKIDPAAIFGNWEEIRYHMPQDDMDQPGLDFDAAAKFARFVFLCGYLVRRIRRGLPGTREIFFGYHYAKSGRQVVGTLRSHLAMIRDLWQSIAHGKQRRSKSRKKKPKKPAPPKVHQPPVYSTNKPTTPKP